MQPIIKDETWKLIEQYSLLLAQHKKSIAFAESVTAGYVSFLLSRTKHSKDIFKGGVICYSEDVERQLLKVPPEVIKKHTPESLQAAKAITLGLKEIINADIYVGITGLSRDGGSETPEKPVGTIFTYILTSKGELTDRALFSGKENVIIEHAIENIFQLLIYQLKAESKN